MCTNKVISYASVPQTEETLSAVMSIKHTNNTKEKLSMRVGGRRASRKGYWDLQGFRNGQGRQGA